jgi:hypothetical protein
MSFFRKTEIMILSKIRFWKISIVCFLSHVEFRFFKRHESRRGTLVGGQNQWVKGVRKERVMVNEYD